MVTANGAKLLVTNVPRTKGVSAGAALTINADVSQPVPFMIASTPGNPFPL